MLAKNYYSDDETEEYEELHTSAEWCRLQDAEILDYDGWGTNDIYGEIFEPCNFHETLITKHEFTKRLLLCTIFLKVEPTQD